MKLARAGLILAAIVFVLVGLGFLIAPVSWASVVEIALPTATARTDLRATYGGFDLGFGVFLGLCAARAEWIRAGLVALCLAGAGFGGGRLLGIVVEGSASPLMGAFAVLELATTGLALLLLRRLPQAERQ
jgi:Domain of unknown function (DUF4345)